MKNVVLLFGGQSTEHDISRKSVMTFIEHIDRTLYAPILVGITREGQWLLYNGEAERITQGTWAEKGIPAVISPDAKDKSLLIMKEDGVIKIGIEAVIPVLHGLYGEDGSVQGLLRLAKIPFVGCGILASAVAMDKFYTKLIVEPLGIRQAAYVGAYKEHYNQRQISEAVEKKLGYPVFIKPSNAGSSIGVSKATNATELHQGLMSAFEYDRKVLIEEEIVGREIECAVMGNLSVEASDVGEILSADEFYDFDAKYNNASSKTIVSAEMDEMTREGIRESAIKVFKAIDGRGLARVDFFIEEKSGEIVFNEINTFPGFTNISMYPKLMIANGVDLREQITRFIELGIEDAEK